MSSDTALNAVISAICILIGCTAFSAAVFLKIWFHIGSSVVCVLLFRHFFFDSQYGIESVYSYLKRMTRDR